MTVFRSLPRATGHRARSRAIVFACRSCSRCSSASILTLLLLCGSLLSPALGESGWGYVIFEAAASSSALSDVRVDSSQDDVNVVAWRDSQNTVWTRTITQDGLLDPVPHGIGGPADLIRTASGFTLVYASGNVLVLRDGDGTAWSPPAYVYSVTGAPPKHPNLGRAHPPAPEDLYLTWIENEELVLISSRISGSWRPPELAHEAPSSASVNKPRVETYLDNGYPRPRVYFALHEGEEFVYVQESNGAWSDRIPLHYSAFGTDLAVAVDSNMLHVLAGLGPQPL